MRYVILLAVCVFAACAQKTTKHEQPLASSGGSNVNSHSTLHSNDYARVFTSSVNGQHLGAVASVNPIATQAGLDAFAKGGNAIDAALAVAFTLGVVDSHNSGIGGGCFILARLADGRILAIDGREMAPAAAREDMYIVDGKVQPQLSKTGALAVGIPGSIAAYSKLQTMAGQLNFSDVILPAAKVAEEGFAIDKTLALRLGRTAERLAKFPQAAAIYLKADLQPLMQGEVLRQEDLARSYRALAKYGADWFYKGAFAQKTQDWMQANGGIVSAEDFANYTLVMREPVKNTVNGYTIYGFPPPSSGGAHVAQILNILNQLDLPSRSEVDTYHLIAEAMKLAFADRAYWMGDSDFVPVPKGLTYEEYAKTLAKKIQLNTAAKNVSFHAPPMSAQELFGKHTTHLTTADADGNWVAITTTLNTSFGSKVVVPGTGVLLNNQMDDFVAQPGLPNAFGLVGAKANSIAPGKRPLSSMSPTLVLQGDVPVLTLGAAGGPTIISQVAQVLTRTLLLDDDITAAMEHPRVHHQWRPDLLFVEPTIDDDVKSALKEKGHTLKDMGSFGGTQSIYWDGENFTPVTEPRVIQRNQQ